MLFEVSLSFFFAGWIGMSISFWRQNILIFFIMTEVMFLGIVTSLLVLSNYLNNVEALIFALIILTLAALETAIGLCILVQAKNFIDKLSFGNFHSLNG